MIRKISIKLSIFMILISFCFPGGCKDIYMKHEDITVKKAFSLIHNNSGNNNFVILDVRTPGEFTSGHIENAININFNSPAFRDSLASLDRNAMYLVYCRSGNRSAKAINVMKELNFTKTYNIVGGIVEWIHKGFPTVK